MIWLLALTTCGLALWIIAFPFFASRTIHWVDSRLPHVMRRRTLREEKAKCLVALKELDFDFETGKLSKDDYKDLRSKYENKAIEIMKEQDALNAKWQDATNRVEKILQDISPSPPKLSPTPPEGIPCAHCQAKVAPTDRFCGKCGNTLSGFCSSCGAQSKVDDRFCAKCGKALGGGVS